MASFTAGFHSKVRIDSSVYTAQRWNVRDTTPDGDVTNTEGVNGNPSAVSTTEGFAAAIPLVSKAEATVTNATFDALESPWAAPRSVTSGLYLINLSIFLNELTGLFWFFPSFLVTESSQDADVQGLMPITFRGRSDGFYSTP